MLRRIKAVMKVKGDPTQFKQGVPNKDAMYIHTAWVRVCHTLIQFKFSEVLTKTNVFSGSIMPLHYIDQINIKNSFMFFSFLFTDLHVIRML